MSETMFLLEKLPERWREVRERQEDWRRYFVKILSRMKDCEFSKRLGPLSALLFSI
jgi:hypothetical protein